MLFVRGTAPLRSSLVLVRGGTFTLFQICDTRALPTNVPQCQLVGPLIVMLTYRRNAVTNSTVQVRLPTETNVVLVRQHLSRYHRWLVIYAGFRVLDILLLALGQKKCSGPCDSPKFFGCHATSSNTTFVARESSLSVSLEFLSFFILRDLYEKYQSSKERWVW